MSLKLTILGCHSATPRINAHPTSQFLEIKNHHFLIDCGEGTQVQLRKFGVKFSKIKHIFISHLHGDHFFGLVGLISTFRLLNRETELHVYGPKGIKEAITLQLKLSNSWTQYPLLFRELTSFKSELIFEDKKVEGFPFQYSITLKYELTNTALSLDVEIKNLDSNSFPFNLGWHPYFSTTNLFNSTLLLNSYKKIVVNNSMIPVNEEEINWEKPIKIENKTFDDCYVLNNNSITFKTPEYQFEFSFSTTENYLQLYTPLNRKTIAIEPQTAPANSFNNGKGIQVLKPNESYNLNWNINLKP